MGAMREQITMGFSVGGALLGAQRRGRNTYEASAVAPTGLPGALIDRPESLTAPAGLMLTLTTLSVTPPAEGAPVSVVARDLRTPL
jgi:hypothetical protein